MFERQDSELPRHVTTPLLQLIAEGALDQDYAAAARRQAAMPDPDTPPQGRSGWATTAIAVGIFGLLVCIAFVQTRDQAADRLASRSSMIEQITDLKTIASSQQDRAGRLRATIGRLEAAYDDVNADANEQEQRRQRLLIRTGFAAVTGEGVRITVTDPIGARPEDGVRDTDIALIVDGLWNSGAEAIAINGHRLTALTAIRNSSYAVHVGGQPLSPPYTVEAIGDIRTLQGRWVASQQGARFLSLAQNLGFGVTRQNVEKLRLPAARTRTLRFAVADKTGATS